MESTSKISDWLHRCVRCGNCKYVFREYVPSCPSGAFYFFESFFASGRIKLAQAMEEGLIDWDDSIKESLFSCTTCASCQEQCLAPHHESIVEIIEAARVKVVETQGALPQHKAFSDNIVVLHNPYGASHHDQMLREELGLPEKAEYVYFIGCTSNYREKQIRDATISLLIKGGVDFTIVDEYCCSSPLLRTGQLKQVEGLMEHNSEQITNTSAQRVITSCAGCYRTLKDEYQKKGYLKGVEVLHISELIERLLEKKHLMVRNSSMKTTVTYHDPCHLGRHMNVYENPRNVLQLLGVDMIEMQSNQENAWCCGAGGGVKAAFKPMAKATGTKRVQDALETGTKTLVTTCPFCVRNLSDSDSGNQLEVIDLSELVDRLT